MKMSTDKSTVKLVGRLFGHYYFEVMMATQPEKHETRCQCYETILMKSRFQL